MADISIIVRCDYCGERTRIVVTSVEKRLAAAGQQKQKLVYCEHCNRANLITVSANWDRRDPVLGDADVLELAGGIPVVQGQKA